MFRLDIHLCTNRADSKQYHKSTYDLNFVDSFAVYCPDTKRCYFLNSKEIGTNISMISLRVLPTKNSQKIGIIYAEDYIDTSRIFL